MDAEGPRRAASAPEATGAGAAPDGAGAPDGIDRAGVERWMAERAGARPPLAFERIAGGHSNLTYAVADAAGGRWALRRPPLGERLGSAHDMAREHRVIAGLQGGEVPVPPLVGLCEDESVNGAPFYVMGFVDGPVLRGRADAERHFPDVSRRHAIGVRVVDALAALHAIDPDAVGLGELGRKQAYVERQLRRWSGQWEKSKTRELDSIDSVHERLAARIPDQGPAAIVHGDYRLDNMILSPAGEIAAVVDWELCTLGDPLADVGLLLVYWSQPGDAIVPLFDPPTLAEGFPLRDEVVARYAERSGRDLAAIDFYVALGYWKLAIILEGVYARYSAGQYGNSGGDFEGFARTVESLAEAADTALS